MQRIHTYIGVTTVAGRTGPAGYGFGLNIRDDATLGTIVAHAGGLPGYGSNMRWLSGRGLGVIALSNTTYAPMSVLTMRLLETMHENKALPPIPAPTAPAWEMAAQRLVDLLNDWDDAVAAELFEDNVALDDSLERRRAEADALIATHGSLRIAAMRPASAASGEFDVRGSARTVRIYMEQSPSPGSPVQLYTIHHDS
jgi:hypothetical protein